MTETQRAPLAPKMTPTSAPFWAALGEGQVVLQQCDDCEAWVFYPRPRCPRCLSAALAWKPASGRATLVVMAQQSWTAAESPQRD